MERPGSRCGQFLTVIEKVCNKTTPAGISTKKESGEDLQQLRNATARILQAVTSTKSDRSLKESFIKQNGFTILMMALREGLTDKQTVENIVFILLELLSKPSAGKNATALVRGGATNLFLQILVSESKEHSPRLAFMGQIHQLLAKLGAKDPKFPMKGRLSQALSVTVSMTKSYAGDFKKLIPLLQVLKMYSTNSVNASNLVKQNCVQLMFRIISLCGRTHVTVLKLALEILCNLTKSIKMQPNFDTDLWEKPEVLDKGITLQCCEDDNEDATIKDAKDEIIKESSKKKEVVIELIPRTEKELRLAYEKFFHELQDGCKEGSSNSSDSSSSHSSENDETASPESEAATSDAENSCKPSLFLPKVVSNIQMESPSLKRRSLSPRKDRRPGSLGRKGSQREKKSQLSEGSAETNLSSLLNITTLSTDLPALAPTDEINSEDISIATEFPGLRDTMEHDPQVYLKFARQTKSISSFEKVAYPDYIGAKSLPQAEPLHVERCVVSRENLLDDIDRHLHPEHLINETVYDMDALVSQNVDSGKPTCGPNLVNCDEKTISSCMDKKKKKTGPLKFCSQFESGNLRKAIQIREFEYDLLLDSDINTNSHHQWFYFEISNMVECIPYRFNIINCEKVNSQFNAGMKPVMFSIQESMSGRPFWFRTGSNICYYKNCYTRTRTKSYFTASFNIYFPHTDDICYLAYHYPYTYSTLMTHLKSWEEMHDPSEISFNHQTLCETLSGNPVPVLTISAAKNTSSSSSSPSSDEQQTTKTSNSLQDKPYVFLDARVHPGESNSSWVMKGIIDFLMSTKAAAQELRDMYIFKIIPMLNPDGVINGNHRCSLAGYDLNRKWGNPCPKLHPIIYHTKGLLLYMKNINKVPIIYCDLHGHSQKKNIFIYGCSSINSWKVGDSDNPTWKLKGEDGSYKILPYILDRMAPAFSLADTKYSVEKMKEGSARVIVWREVGVVKSYCMESTYCGFDQGIYQNTHVGTHHLHEMGHRFCESILQLSSMANMEIESSSSGVTSAEPSSLGVSDENGNVDRMDTGKGLCCERDNDENSDEDDDDDVGEEDERLASSDEENAQQQQQQQNMAVGWEKKWKEKEKEEENESSPQHPRNYDNEVDY